MPKLSVVTCFALPLIGQFPHTVQLALNLSKPAVLSRAQDPQDQSLAMAARGHELVPTVHTVRRLPLYFESNCGQADPRVRFLSRGPRYTLLLTSTEAMLRFATTARRGDVPVPWHFVRMALRGSNPKVPVEGQNQLPGRTNYFLGKDPSKWRTDIPTFQRVVYDDVYPGIDLVFYGNDQQLEYDFVLGPGADARAIQLDFSGVERMHVDDRGDLILYTAGGILRQQRPVIQQGGRTISGAYAVRSGGVGFQIGPYDQSRPLTIDPILTYGSFFGGRDFDTLWDAATDPSGNIYLTGQTGSVDFPLESPLQTGLVALQDAYITKLNPAADTMIYSTYLGGAGNSNRDLGDSIVADAVGNAYVTGFTDSPDFPTTPGAYDPSCGTGGSCSFGLPDAFVTKIAPAGNALVFSTFFGGSSTDRGRGVAVDPLGNVYVAGFTLSTDLPISANAPDALCNNCAQGEAYVMKLTASGAGLAYATYLGGDAEDGAWDIAVDGAGQAHVTGYTQSFDFPAVNALQPFLKPVSDIFVTKFNASGTEFIFSTYLGGSDDDEGADIDVDVAGLIYVTGHTFSNDFPTTSNAFQRNNMGWSEVFVTKLAPGGRALIYSTYLGGSAADVATALAVDTDGRVHVVGLTQSEDFPATNAFQPGHGGSTWDAFVARLNSGGSALMYASFLGGSLDDEGRGVALMPGGDEVTAGWTLSPDFPVSPGAFDAICDAGASCNDAFVSMIRFQPCTTACLRSKAIQLTVQENGALVTVIGFVSFADENGTPIESAAVTAVWLRPDGSVQQQTVSTNADGIATLATGATTGTYMLTVLSAARAGYTFDADGSSLAKRISR